MRDEMGRDEGRVIGPEPGKGADVHELSGEADFDGLPGDELPPRKQTETKADRKARTDGPKKAAD